MKNENNSKWVSSLPVPSLMNARTHRRAQIQACINESACAQIEILERTFTARGTTSLTNWSDALVALCLFVVTLQLLMIQEAHVSLFNMQLGLQRSRQQMIAGSQILMFWVGTWRTVDNLTHGTSRSVYFWPVKCVYTVNVIAVSLCSWLDGGNQFGLHACVFLCTG